MEVEPTEGKRKAAPGTPGRDLCRAILPIYYLGKLCGLIPVRFLVHAPNERCQARLNVLDLVYSFCVLIFLIGAEIWGLWRDLKDGWEYSTRLKSRTAVIVTCSDVVGVMSLSVVGIVGSSFRWKYLQLVVNKLIEVDNKIGIPSTKNARRFTIGLTVCSLAYLWLNSILDFYTWDHETRVNNKMTTGKGPINFAPLYFMYTVNISVEIQYTVSTYIIGQRFVRLNERLRELLNNCNSRNGYGYENDNPTDYFRKYGYGNTEDTLGRFYIEKSSRGQGGDREELVEQRNTEKAIRVAEGSNRFHVNDISELMMVHSSLCDVVALVNNAFGFVVLTVTVSCLLHLVITPYFLILQIGQKNEWIFLVVQCGWCIFHVARIFLIVQPSYSTVVEGKRTAALVSQLLFCNYETNVRRELEIFSLQLLHRPLEFSACGLFPLDRTLITSIAGVVTTYLVILMQFQHADDAKDHVDILRNVTRIIKTVSPNITGSKIV
ncbi:gustatory receptor for sugar taste 43a [Xylocopa sonorina]|uniref:gustatory receptor for sugar taste 43a n=1 Tax=Xylocopa sonorina TaxID=1818115 RepID=UPI00403AB0F1